MKILVVSATFEEIMNTISIFEIETQSYKNFFTKKFSDNEISFLITGIGSYAMLYNLTVILQKNNYDIVVNVGIAGSYDKSIRIGDIVLVESEEIGDLGIDNKDTFNTLFEHNFLNKNDFPFVDGKLICNYTITSSHLPVKTVKSLSLNTVGGEKNKIEIKKQKFDVQIESMEGAAFFYVCLLEKVNFIEIRAISNFVEPRNKESWEIMLAIKNLNDNLKLLLLDLLDI
ncbi:MAG: futalosine hydrolase [Bacteroidota bacterium]|nr:futalosine hydrolase [Bacteroidota bacterium]